MISINLLPSEITQNIKINKKFRQLQLFSTLVLVVLFAVSLATFGLGFLQSQTLSKVKQQLSGIEEQVNTYKKQEAVIAVLKNRLATISQFATRSSKQRVMYSLIHNLTPQVISVSSIVVDRGGAASLSITTADNLSLSDFIASLLSKEKNEDSISSVAIESLARGKDGIYRVTLKIKPK